MQFHPGLHPLDPIPAGGGGGDGAALFIERAIVDGATISVGDLVSLSPTFGGTAAGRVRALDARFATLAPWYIGVCTVGGTGDAGGTVMATIQIAGVYTDAGAAFTPGPLFASVTGTGRPVNTIPSGPGNYWIEAGLAVSATEWIVLPGARFQLLS